MTLKAVVMAGGEGTRLRPLTCNRPKPLAMVANRPIMEHILLLLREHGMAEAYATLYYLAEDVQQYFGNGHEWGVSLHYTVEDSPLGTAGSVGRLRESLDDTFVIVSGDAMTDFDLSAAVAFHRERDSWATLVLTRVPEPLEYGVVITGGDGSITRFLEKPSWGEVFSDTVNTGIYILEPQVLEYIDPSRQVDFSRDLFPALLQDNRPLFGYVAEGYWTDIGNLQQYQQANYDALESRVKVTLPGREVAPGVWVGAGTQVDPGASLEGPIIIGRNCVIGRGAEVHDLSVIGDNVTVEEGASIHRSVVMNNAYIGRRARIQGAVLDLDVVSKANTSIAEGAVVGDHCVLEEGTIVQPHIKLWPSKYTEPGAKVTMSMVWGTRWPGTLFGNLGVNGLANVEITPEFAARLGAAFGAYLEPSAQAVTSRETHPVTRMIKRGFVSGLMSVGSNVLDLRTMPCPISRHAALASGAAGGVHVTLAAHDPNQILLIFFDGQGRNLSRAIERKIENIFFREDFRRAHRDGVGEIEHPARVIEYYTEDFLHFVDSGAIRRAAPRLVVDYAYGSLSLLMPVVLGRLGCDCAALHAFVDPTRETQAWSRQMSESAQLSELARALEAALGVIIDTHGERIAVVDDEGQPLGGDDLLAVMIELALADAPRNSRVAVPVDATAAIDEIAARHGASVVRTRADVRSLMEAAANEAGIVFAGDSRGGFIFPQFQPAFDAMASLGKLLEMLTLQELTLAQVRRRVPAIHKHGESVACSWDQKGAIMRRLHEQVHGQPVEQRDGIKVMLDEGWVLVLPDTSTAEFHVYGEGRSQEHAQALVADYIDRIRRLQEAAAD